MESGSLLQSLLSRFTSTSSFHFGNQAVIIHVNSHLEITVNRISSPGQMSRKKSGWGLLFFYETLSATSFNPTSCETDELCVPSQTLLIPEGALKENGLYCVLCRTPQCRLNGVFHLRWRLRSLLIKKINLPSFPGYVGSSAPIFLIVQGEVVHCQIAGSSTLMVIRPFFILLLFTLWIHKKRIQPCTEVTPERGRMRHDLLVLLHCDASEFCHGASISCFVMLIWGIILKY